MVFKIGETLNNLISSFVDNEYIQSPIWTSIMIVIIILLILVYVINKDPDLLEDSVFVFYAKIGILSFIGCAAILFLHNKSISRFYEKRYENVNQKDIVERVVKEVTASIMKTPLQVKPAVAIPAIATATTATTTTPK